MEAKLLRNKEVGDGDMEGCGLERKANAIRYIMLPFRGWKGLRALCAADFAALREPMHHYSSRKGSKKRRGREGDYTHIVFSSHSLLSRSICSCLSNILTSLCPSSFRTS